MAVGFGLGVALAAGAPRFCGVRLLALIVVGNGVKVISHVDVNDGVTVNVGLGSSVGEAVGAGVDVWLAVGVGVAGAPTAGAVAGRPDWAAAARPMSSTAANKTGTIAIAAARRRLPR